MLKGKPYRMGDVLFVCIMTLSLIQVIFGLYMSTSLLVGVKTTEEYKKFVSIAVAWESFALATDALIMCALCFSPVYHIHCVLGAHQLARCCTGGLASSVCTFPSPFVRESI